MKLCKDVWYEIGRYLVFKNFNLLCVSKSFREPFLFMVKSAFVSIDLKDNPKESRHDYLKGFEKYTWCIDKLITNNFNVLSKLNFLRLQSLLIADERKVQSKDNVTLTPAQFPNLKHLAIQKCITVNCDINFNSLDLLSLYINSPMDSSRIHGIKSLQLLHFSSYFSNNGMISLLQTLPNLKFLQIEDGETSDVLHKLFKSVDVDQDFDNFETRWNEEINKIYKSS
jgi:hypothetical protein